MSQQNCRQEEMFDYYACTGHTVWHKITLCTRYWGIIHKLLVSVLCGLLQTELNVEIILKKHEKSNISNCMKHDLSVCIHSLNKPFERIMKGLTSFCCHFANNGELEFNRYNRPPVIWWLNCWYFTLRIASYSFHYIKLSRIIVSVIWHIIVSPCCHNKINNIEAHLVGRA